MMRDYVNEHFAKHPDERVRPSIRTKRGEPLSVQASSHHYCTPRANNAAPYSKVEVYWFGRTPRPLRAYQADPRDVAAYVPVDVVNKLIHHRGGIIG